MRELISRLVVGLFSVNDTGFRAVAALLMIAEAVLSHLVILKVNYTEIDWSTYMQQVECYVNKGILNYTQIGGDTGPCVYPAGHLFVFRLLHFFTSSGRNIRAAQHIFQGFYMFNLFMVFRILHKTMRIPPIVLLLVSITGYRIHSIFVLRLFNDPLAMMLFYVAMDRFLEQKWLVGCVFYSLAVSIKMNVLLFAPALFFTLLLNNSYMATLGYLTVCGLIQLYVGGPFLLYDWKSYLQQSFDLGRVFMFKWTVNWRFLPEEFFLDKRFHAALLVGHLTFLAVFASYMWFRRLNGLRTSVYLRLFEGITTTTGAVETYYAFCTSNLIGIAFSRSLHYQFYSWYFHQIPFLLFCDYPHVASVSTIPWRQFLWKVPLLAAVELSWNVYPSTWWSSALLHVCHVIIFWHLIVTRPARPGDSVSRETLRRLEQRQKMLEQELREHGQVVPKFKFPAFLEEQQEEQVDVRKRMKQPIGEKRTKKQLDAEFETYFEEQMDGFREEHTIYYTHDGKPQVSGLAPLDKPEKMKMHEKVAALYTQALKLQAQLNPNETPTTWKSFKFPKNADKNLLESYLKLHGAGAQQDSEESEISSAEEEASDDENSGEEEPNTEKIEQNSCKAEASEQESNGGVRRRILVD
ncbi:dolichyl-P-Man:Man5GlcNAc2-PP-dolichol alpha-1,3-mannosyltransferase [Caenorhabditis elegans]|uniref:dolichyl-P-Man:Man5GlcNAc2-PP-dolichol alpha-1,3-mannosyltransferase n=2 Tax=Caenorhabditis elegans TaxID=6239 RepID=E5QCI3_CAEEL|nr:Dol-P-Man:Man(5)GlcNAc(2)-PP-Dol alpha-1,3-mannosyltransferase [Caenorhabditis elegans]CBY25187.1 Dol-P-Man:Man(5)GlcNAc(2)-PP-Dol alpha-1,3-mannosyltransferase [Caenorhabditis elegans]|eukprot:NP_001254418.1 Asparagine Linked Glycosylation (ALG) homolog, Nematode [Caenorhabditis elegans]